jgi:phosphatidylserine decarboxylase
MKMKIHREGYTILIVTFAILFIMNAAVFYFYSNSAVLTSATFFISCILFLLVLQFFRYPQRDLSRNDDYVICPADGKVVVIEETFEPEYFKDKRLQVSIFMSPLNVHANWYPVSGLIKFLRYHKGKKLVAWHPKASTENERTTMVIEKDDKSEILVRQIAGALANRIVYYPMEGDMIRQCSELGFIKFGSRVDVYLPLTAKVNVRLDQKVTGGIDVLAILR